MDLRTHIWGILLTVVIGMVVGIPVVGWLRPLPSGVDQARAEVDATWEAYDAGDLPQDQAAGVMADLASARLGFGEAMPADNFDNDPYESVHREAVRRLGQIKGQAAFDALCRLAVIDDRHVNLYAVEALRHRGDKAAMPTLLAALSHDDRRQKRLDDHYARVTQETLRAIRDLADGTTLPQLREFVSADRRMFDQDIRRTIALIAADQTAPVDAATRLGETQNIEDLFNPDPTRLGTPGVLGESLSQPARSGSPLLSPGRTPADAE